MDSAIRNFFSVPFRRRAAQTIPYHRLEAFEASDMAACIACIVQCAGLCRHDKVDVKTASGAVGTNSDCRVIIIPFVL